MNKQGHDSKVTSDWDAYWQNTQLDSANRQEGGPKDAALDRFWTAFFTGHLAGIEAPITLLDIACGRGPVIRHAQTALAGHADQEGVLITGLDSSPAALAETRSRYPGSSCVAANGTHLPFPDASFNLVTSQFGIEYAGPDAWLEACRVLQPRGTIATILHLHDGRIYRESRGNLEAVNDFKASGLLTGLAGIFDAAIAVHQGSADIEHFRQTDNTFAAAVKTTEAVIQQWGKGIADGLLFKIYTDVGHIYRNFKNYNPQEVSQWIDNVSGELASYTGRMASMLNSALDQNALDAQILKLAANQVKLDSRGVIQLGSPPLDSAWTLVATRQA